LIKSGIGNQKSKMKQSGGNGFADRPKPPPLLFYEQRAFNFRFWILDFGLQQLQTKNKETVLPLSTQNSQRRLFATDYTDFHG
jgi:hypothetical protein